MNLKAFRQTLTALRFVPLRTVLLRLRREFCQHMLTRPTNSLRGLMTTRPDARTTTASLQHPNFLAFAKAIRNLTKSSFSYDASKNALVFSLSNDLVLLDEVTAVPWAVPSDIPSSDVNRCFFLSFAEQATLLNDDPETDLVRLDAFVARLARAAPLNCGRLTIPWQSLSAARRLVNVIAGLSSILARDSTLTGRAEVTRLINHVALCYDIVATIREDDLGYNHLASEIFAQCVADRLFDDRAALERHAREFVATMTAQVGADGMQLERSATYQAHLLGHLDALVAGQILPEPHQARIAQLATTMRMALALMTHRDGNIAVFNDAAIGDGPSPMVLGAGNQDFTAGIHLLPTAGYARLEHGAFSAIFDAGPCGADDNPGHAHADFLSFELDVGETRFIVDPGVASYKAGLERDACRSAAYHNGPTFPGVEPIEFLGAFRIGRRGRGRFLDHRVTESLNKIAPGIGGTQDGFEWAGGRVARWLAIPCSDAMLIADGWHGMTHRDARSAFLVEGTNWLIESVSSAQVLLNHRVTNERVALVALSGSLAIQEGLRYHPFGPKRSFPALQVLLTPDPPKGPSRKAVLAVLRGDQISTDFREVANQIATALLILAVDG